MKRNPVIIPDDYPKYIQTTDEALLKIWKRLPDIDTIYYPCCKDDRRLEMAFPKAKIVYLDINPSSFENNVNKWNISVIADANEYVCEKPVDMVFLYNPVIFPSKIESSIKSHWYILANDFHSSARALIKNENFNKQIGFDEEIHKWE